MVPPSAERTAAELAAHGLRATRQRVEILRILRRRSVHPTATEIHRAARAAVPRVSLKTVYQALDALVSAGLASRISEGGEPARYEAGIHPHYHTRCRVCGRLDDVPASCDGPIRRRTPLPRGFEIERIAVTLLGTCSRCRR